MKQIHSLLFVCLNQTKIIMHPTSWHSATPTSQHSATPTSQHSATPTSQHSATPTSQHSATPTSQQGTAVIGGSCHKYFLLPQNKIRLLSQQKYVCCNNFCHDKCNFGKVATNVFVVTKQIFCCDISMQKFCCDKHNFVATKLLLCQAYFCCDKRVCVATNFLLQQKWYLCQWYMQHPPVNTVQLGGLMECSVAMEHRAKS